MHDFCSCVERLVLWCRVLQVVLHRTAPHFGRQQDREIADKKQVKNTGKGLNWVGRISHRIPDYPARKNRSDQTLV